MNIEEERKKTREVLERILPQFVYSEMDGGIFWKGLTRPDSGSTITRDDGKEFIVQYSWHWTTYAGTPIYMAELEPKEEEQ